MTDNATNFGKAFKIFSIQSQTTSSIIPNISNDNWFISSDNKSNIDKINSDKKLMILMQILKLLMQKKYF